jgi:hypothetical protein
VLESKTADIGIGQPSTGGDLSVCHHPSVPGTHPASHCSQRMLASGFGLVVGGPLLLLSPRHLFIRRYPSLVTWLLAPTTHPMSSGLQQRVWVLGLSWWLGGQCDAVGIWAQGTYLGGSLHYGPPHAPHFVAVVGWRWGHWSLSSSSPWSSSSRRLVIAALSPSSLLPYPPLFPPAVAIVVPPMIHPTSSCS